MKSPCKKDCPDRKAGCHSVDCPHGWSDYEAQYIDQLKAKNELKAAKAKRFTFAKKYSDKKWSKFNGGKLI